MIPQSKEIELYNQLSNYLAQNTSSNKLDEVTAYRIKTELKKLPNSAIKYATQAMLFKSISQYDEAKKYALLSLDNLNGDIRPINNNLSVLMQSGYPATALAQSEKLENQLPEIQHGVFLEHWVAFPQPHKIERYLQTTKKSNIKGLDERLISRAQALLDVYEKSELDLNVVAQFKKLVLDVAENYKLNILSSYVDSYTNSLVESLIIEATITELVDLNYTLAEKIADTELYNYIDSILFKFDVKKAV